VIEYVERLYLPAHRGVAEQALHASSD
jgi:hypothetical protein